MNVSRRFNLGGLRAPTQPGRAQQGGVAFQRGGGGGQGGFGGPQGGNRGNQGNNNSRFGIELFAQARNVLNHVTKTGYTGNMSSPFFGQATSVNGGRDINVGLRFQF
jgi:hypothetical protein